jgi:mannosyltransferase
MGGRRSEVFLEAAAVATLLALTLALRLYRIGAPSLWADEGNSVALAGRPFAVIAANAALDIHPPLYYFTLRLWTAVFGVSESALRGLSVAWSMVLAGAVYLLGRRLYGRAGALLALLFAAVSPFQIYYAQEARMYMMMAALAALCAYAGWRLTEGEAGAARPDMAALYVLAAAAGLYTHYFFPAVLLTLNLVFLAAWLERSRRWPALGRWAAMQAIAVLLYLPWLPIGVSRLGAWPAGAVQPDALSWLGQAWRTLCLGPAAKQLWPALGFVPALIAGLWPARRRDETWAAWLLPFLGWLLPLAVMGAAGLYSESRLKFLLAGSPFLALSLARVGRRIDHLRDWLGLRGALAGAVCLAVVLPSAGALARYYGEPAAGRDDYRGMVGYIAAIGRPGDAIILNAPGQWDVFSYYYRGDWPVYRLPESRPPDAAALETRLGQIVAAHGRLFVLYWATDESDPQRVMETWLDSHAFKGIEAWNGNVRFVMYATPAYDDDRMVATRLQASFGPAIVLEQVERSIAPLAAGDLLPLQLTWRAVAQPAGRYKVFIQALDAGNHLVGQRDAEPASGARPTTAWSAGETIVDHHALFIEPGTPPGHYRLIAGLYDIASGTRLNVAGSGADYVELGEVSVERPAMPLPATAVRPAYRSGVAVGPLTLLGYDRHALGGTPAADAPLSAGAPLHLALYWQARQAPAGDWFYRLWLGQRLWLDWTPLGASYPTSQWQAGELVRDQVDLFLPGDLRAGRYQLRLEARRPAGETARLSLGVVSVH